jgi:ribonuclease D
MQEQFVPKPVWVDSPASLVNTAKILEGFPSISVDTESNSLYVYHEQVCLVQISTPGNDFLLDTLALDDLSPLAGIFANEKQEKIFHASEYDVICLKRDFGFEFANLFDTMIAARILGEDGIGLASLLKSRLGLELDKKYQRANWGIRPLPQSMLDYACEDSHYLFRLRTILEDELRKKGLWNLAQEDFRLACKVAANPATAQPKNCWKVAGANEINSQEAAILQELCTFREQEAGKQNVPPFKVFSNELMVSLSRLQPGTIAELKQFKGMNERMVRKYGEPILKAIHDGLTSAPLKRPKKTKPDEQYLRRFDALRDWRKNKGKELEVESDVILPRDFLESIAAANPKSTNELTGLMSAVPWRYEHFGKEIIKVIKQQEV